jgi:hypothetical protein
MFQQIRKWKWIISATVCFLLLYMLPASFIETYYSTGIFLFIRKLLDGTFGKLPFPSFYLFVGFLVVVVLKWILHFFREKPQPVLQRLFKMLSFVAFIITLFFILWGFNYGRIPVEEKLHLSVEPITQEKLSEETQETITELTRIRKMLKKDTNSIPQIAFINKIEQTSRDALNSTLQQYNYPFSKKIRGRFLLDDMLLVFSIGGQYLPFVGEGNVDDAVYYSKKPFYMIHEMAHGNGFTEEAACNLFAYVSCKQSGNLALQYSGELNYLLYLLSDLKYRNEDVYDSINKAMPRVVQKDLDEIKKYYESHTFKTGFLGDAINNSYLKLLGIKDGIKNYDKMLLMVYAWKNQHKE